MALSPKNLLSTWSVEQMVNRAIRSNIRQFSLRDKTRTTVEGCPLMVVADLATSNAVEDLRGT